MKNQPGARIASAYLVVTLDVTGVVPCVREIGIYSATGTYLTTMAGDIRADVMRMHGETYSEASKKLENFINATPGYEWARPWIARGPTARHDIENLRRCAKIAAGFLGARMARQ